MIFMKKLFQKVVARPFPELEKFQPNYDVARYAMDLQLKKAQKELFEQRQKQVMQVLSLHGHTFENREQYIKFISENCSISNNGNPYIETLYLSGKPICKWDNTPDIKIEGYTGTITWGEIHLINPSLENLNS